MTSVLELLTGTWGKGYILAGFVNWNSIEPPEKSLNELPRSDWPVDMSVTN